MEIIVPIVLILLLAWREWDNHKERKDLLDRLMSRDLTDYKDLNEKKEDEPKDVETDFEKDFVDVTFSPETIADDIKEEIEYGGEKG